MLDVRRGAFDVGLVISETPAQLGYRMPAEWEPHAATWLSWPRREGISFPDSFDLVLPALRTMVVALTESEPVCINVCRMHHLPYLSRPARRSDDRSGIDLAQANVVRQPLT
jgi:agmatine/peptidylarginine deiminase